MSRIKIAKVTALPGTLVANTIYMVTTGADQLEVYMVDQAGTATRRLPTEADTQALIDASLAGLSGIEVLEDIAARDAITPTSNMQVMVLDASADLDVETGAATYVYQIATTTWHKISEAESLDFVLDWNNMVNGPVSAPAAIDAAVGNSHTHANKTQLDLIGQDSDGDATYNGSKIANEYTTIAW